MIPMNGRSRSRSRWIGGRHRAQGPVGVLDLCAVPDVALASAALVGGTAAGWSSLTQARIAVASASSVAP